MRAANVAWIAEKTALIVLGGLPCPQGEALASASGRSGAPLVAKGKGAGDRSARRSRIAPRPASPARPVPCTRPHPIAPPLTRSPRRSSSRNGDGTDLYPRRHSRREPGDPPPPLPHASRAYLTPPRPRRRRPRRAAASAPPSGCRPRSRGGRRRWNRIGPPGRGPPDRMPAALPAARAPTRPRASSRRTTAAAATSSPRSSSPSSKAPPRRRWPSRAWAACRVGPRGSRRCGPEPAPGAPGHLDSRLPALPASPPKRALLLPQASLCWRAPSPWWAWPPWPSSARSRPTPCRRWAGVQLAGGRPPCALPTGDRQRAAWPPSGLGAAILSVAPASQGLCTLPANLTSPCPRSQAAVSTYSGETLTAIAARVAASL